MGAAAIPAMIAITAVATGGSLYMQKKQQDQAKDQLNEMKKSKPPEPPSLPKYGETDGSNDALSQIRKLQQYRSGLASTITSKPLMSPNPVGLKSKLGQ